MKRILLTAFCFGAVFFASTPVFSQLAVKLKIAQYNYMPYEPIFAQISIRNFSAHAVAFGGSERLKGSLHFEIIPDGKKTMKKIPLIKEGVLPPLTGSIIPPGATRDFTFNICDYYDMRTLGRYCIRAVVKHNLFRDEYISEDKYVSIVKGSLIWSMNVGIPSLTGENDITEKNKKVQQRKYAIYSYSIGQKTQVYNLLIEDDDMVYVNRRIAFDLGPELRPECEIDFLSRLNIIVAASPRVFAYYVFNTDGHLEKRKVLIKESVKPILSVDSNSGYVTVVGGREAEQDKDYQELQNLPFLGSSKSINAGTLPPPKGDAMKRLNAIED